MYKNLAGEAPGEETQGQRGKKMSTCTNKVIVRHPPSIMNVILCATHVLMHHCIVQLLSNTIILRIFSEKNAIGGIQ